MMEYATGMISVYGVMIIAIWSPVFYKKRNQSLIEERA